MIYLLLGTSSYLLLVVHDYENLRSRKLLKYVLGSTAISLLIFSYVGLWSVNSKWPIPPPARITGYVGSVIFLLLLIYSLVVEVPFRSTYVEENSSLVIVDTGTYALARHPGVLWWFGFLVSSFISSGSPYMLGAAVLWTTMNGVYVTVQERFFFPRIFGTQYEEYKKLVPMLLPTGRSIRRCLATLRGKK